LTTTPPVSSRRSVVLRSAPTGVQPAPGFVAASARAAARLARACASMASPTRANSSADAALNISKRLKLSILAASSCPAALQRFPADASVRRGSAGVRFFFFFSLAYAVCQF